MLSIWENVWHLPPPPNGRNQCAPTHVSVERHSLQHASFDLCIDNAIFVPFIRLPEWYVHDVQGALMLAPSSNVGVVALLSIPSVAARTSTGRTRPRIAENPSIEHFRPW